jgi:PleD family two-component response regulator
MAVDGGKAAPQVVVADDDRVTREYVAGLLRGHGYDVTAVENGQKALDRCRSGAVSLVLLDVVMDGISGIDVCRMLKSTSQGAFLPVILLTARSDTDSRVEGLRIGADDYICKPFDERELLARVANMVRIKQMHDEVAQARERLERLAVRDELTGLYNYRYLQTRISEEFKRAERYREPLSCAMLDIDHFKSFNDRFGHDVGDRVLKAVPARTWRAR